MKNFFLLLLALFILNACTTERSVYSAKSSAAQLNTELGLAYLQQHQFQLAQIKLLLAKQQDPESAQVLSALAYFYQNTGRPSQAKNYYQEALIHSPKNPDVLNNYGAFLCQQKDYAQAMQIFQRAEQQSTYVDMDVLYENAGLCAYLNHNSSLAKKMLQKSVAINPYRGLANQLLLQLNSVN